MIIIISSDSIRISGEVVADCFKTEAKSKEKLVKCTHLDPWVDTGYGYIGPSSYTDDYFCAIHSVDLIQGVFLTGTPLKS